MRWGVKRKQSEVTDGEPSPSYEGELRASRLAIGMKTGDRFTSTAALTSSSKLSEPVFVSGVQILKVPRRQSLPGIGLAAAVRKNAARAASVCVFMLSGMRC